MMMLRTAVCLVLAGAAASGQGGPPPPQAAKSKPFLRSRRGLALIGVAAAGAGAALLATSRRITQASAPNCSFYPGPFVPCAPVRAVAGRSGAQDGLGGGLLVGGAVVLYVAAANK